MKQISEEELQALVQRVISSGELGRSKTYAAILNYLMSCSINGEQPKEMAIAIDVLGREADFDVGRDSIVRVHIYHLRNKLEAYFAGTGQAETWRLVIPRGQYLLTAIANTSQAPIDVETDENPAVNAGSGESGREKDREGGALAGGQRREKAAPRWHNSWLFPALSAVLAVLLTITLFYESASTSGPSVAEMEPWATLLRDDEPVTIVAGDYFIFGEVGASGNIDRLVRDFEINSSQDLEMRYLLEPESTQRFYNLELSYLPTSIADGLMQVLPVLAAKKQQLRFRLASKLQGEDLTGSHIVYLGYVSGLRSLEAPVFAGSSLRVGTTYDELLTREGESYSSNAGLQGFRGEFRDYGLLSTFPSPRGHQVVVIAGMWDAALESLALASTSVESLSAVHQDLTSQAIDPLAWEVLLEVQGRDQTGYSSRRVALHELRKGRIWGGEN